MKSADEIWSKSISKLQKNIYNFSIRYVNNSLANASNTHKWGKTTSETTVVSNNKLYLLELTAGYETNI